MQTAYNTSPVECRLYHERSRGVMSRAVTDVHGVTVAHGVAVCLRERSGASMASQFTGRRTWSLQSALSVALRMSAGLRYEHVTVVTPPPSPPPTHPHSDWLWRCRSRVTCRGGLDPLAGCPRRPVCVPGLCPVCPVDRPLR